MIDPRILLAEAVAVLALAIGAFFYGAHIGRGEVTVEWQREKLALQAQYAQALEQEAAKRQLDQAVSQANARKASKNYEDALAQKDADYAAQRAADRRTGGLRIPAAACPAAQPAAAPEAAGTGRPDEASPATVELPERTQERLYRLTDRADSLAEQLRHLQEWVVANGFYGEPEPK